MELKPQKYRLALVLRSMFFPIIFPDCVDSLSNREFSVKPFPPRTAFVGNRAYVSGRVAEKDDTIVDINSDRHILACEGENLTNVISIMNELIDIAQKDFLVSLNDVDYLELNANLVVTSDKDAVNSIRELYADTKVMKQFSEILKTALGSFSITLAPKEALPTDRKWFDIRIEPRITKPTTEYYVHIVFRNRDIKDVLDFSNALESMIRRLLLVVEGNKA